MKKLFPKLLLFAAFAFALFGGIQIFSPEIINLWSYRSDGLYNLFGIGVSTISLGFIALAGTNGTSILGGPNMTLGPCNIYYKTGLKPALTGTITNLSANLTGTVAVAPIANTTKGRITGTTTTFTSDLVVGGMVVIDGTNKAKVLSITSDTSAVIDTAYTITSGKNIKKALTTVTGTSTTFLTSYAVGQAITVDGTNYGVITAIASDTSLTIAAPSLLALASSVHRRFTAINLGGTDATTLKIALKKKGLTESQYGEGDADAVVTGGECSIEVGLSRLSLERGEATFQGLKTKKDVNGNYTGFGIGVPLGEADSSIWDQLTLVRIIGGVESSNPLDTIHLPRVAPKTDGEWKFDAASQRYAKTMFTAYRSSEHVTEDGTELFAYAGDMLG